MTDWYKILEVQPSASIAEIKRAFRKKAKYFHPDIPSNNKDAKKNEALMREILRAYEVLSSPSLKAAFDLNWATQRGFKAKSKKVESFDYRKWLYERKDSESRAKLIFFDLLHNREDDAVNEYLIKVKSDPCFKLSQYFDREDFMDCGFILAEELVFRNYFYESLVLLFEVIRDEYKKPYFRHFFPDVLAYTRTILRTKIQATISDELLIEILIYALDLGFGKKDDAFFLKLMAGAYERLGNKNLGKICLTEALQLDPNLKGVKELKKRLGE